MAFGGVGLLALTTASCGVVGVVTNRKLLLQTYAYLAITLLIVEVTPLLMKVPVVAPQRVTIKPTRLHFGCTKPLVSLYH